MLAGPMDRESKNEAATSALVKTNKGSSAKETFIFGSWKCRNARKVRVTANDLERLPYAKRETINGHLHHPPSSSTAAAVPVVAANQTCCVGIHGSPSSGSPITNVNPLHQASASIGGVQRRHRRHNRQQQQQQQQQQHDIRDDPTNLSSQPQLPSTAEQQQQQPQHHRRIEEQQNRRRSEVGSGSVVGVGGVGGGSSSATTRRAISVYDQQLHEQDFWCPRCGGKMEEPRLLACLHSVCNKCVNEFMAEGYYGLSRAVRDSSVDAYQIHGYTEGCPICDFPLPKHGSPVPPPHYSLQHRLVIYAIRRRLSQRAICCDACPDEVQATQHCSTCLCNFCQECGAEHEAQQQQQQQSSPRERPRRDRRPILNDEQRQSSSTSAAGDPRQDPVPPAPAQHRVRPLWEARRVRRVAVCLAHPAHPLRYHCLACQQVTCKECMWRGSHRGHASEDAESAGARAAQQLGPALRRARALLNSLLTEYDRTSTAAAAAAALAEEDDLEEEEEQGEGGGDGEHASREGGGAAACRARTAFGIDRDSVPRTCHFRSRSTISSHSREARERIQEFSRLRRARYLIDAIFIGEDLLANGSDVEILSLKRIILKRLKFLGVAIDAQARFNGANKSVPQAHHAGIYHCCTFCSSGGKKEATCACSGTMPGGYKGCGHGHPGHPGAHHWSCCGSIYRDGVCLLPRKCVFKITL